MPLNHQCGGAGTFPALTWDTAVGALAAHGCFQFRSSDSVFVSDGKCDHIELFSDGVKAKHPVRILRDGD